jgi:hypothetical protein
MSQKKFVFHLVGDSNISRFLPIVKEAKTDQAVQDATLARVVNSVQLKEALTNPSEPIHSTLIISALTNLLTSVYFEDFNRLRVHADRVFNEVLTWLNEGRQALDGFAARVGHFLCLCHFKSLREKYC